MFFPSLAVVGIDDLRTKITSRGDSTTRQVFPNLWIIETSTTLVAKQFAPEWNYRFSSLGWFIQ